MNTLQIAKQIPFKVLLKRVLKRILPIKKINYIAQEFRNSLPEYTINSLLDVTKFKNSHLTQEVIAHYLNHEFNLLGSGWVCRNTRNLLKLKENHQNFHKDVSIIISKKYQFINWQLDVKSGFEFNITKQFDKQVIPKNKDVDVKNCWELGRLQYLPQLSLYAIKTKNKEELILAFKNQTLDFIISNPIGMGVQWACTMDVGIRASNLLLAYDIFKQIDDENILDDKFTSIFSNSIYQHGLFIFNHLEHKEGAAGNHYLFNLLGLLFVANYLSLTTEIKLWKDFATVELIKEFEKQFFSDGGNFEGSTTYHCLSAEAMLYATALMLRNGKKLSQNYINLLYKVACFIKDIVKPNGEIPQFGDNDSGRLFKLNNEDENLLNNISLLAGFAGLFKKEFDEFCSQYALNQEIVSQLVRHLKLENSSYTKPKMPTQCLIPNHQYTKETTIDFCANIKTKEIVQFVYPEFGLYVFKSPHFYLAISTISNKKMHHSWGHVHNDKLSFELQINGVDLVKDAGTYTYSAFPKLRNELRGTKAHHGIVVAGVEQNNFSKEVSLLTYMDREVECKLLAINNTSITLQASYYGVKHVRKFDILSNKLVITDYCNKAFKVNINKFGKHSPNYGTIVDAKY